VAFVHPAWKPPKGAVSSDTMAEDEQNDYDLGAPAADASAASMAASRSAAGSPDEVHADLRYLSHDPKLVNKIMKKRQEEMARRTKLLDTRRFRTGVPHDVLDAQIADKQAAAATIKAEDEYHDKYRVVSDQVAQVCESIRGDATRERQKACTAYSLENHRKETRREYDLSDPNLIKRERPARDGDNDPRLGPSSIQSFEGEDFLAAARKKEATASTREWLKYQMDQKRALAEREQEADRLYDTAMMTANEVRGLCEKADIEEAVAEKIKESEANKRIAEIHHQRKVAAKEREAAAVAAHVDNEMNSERMLESYDYKLGMDGRLMKGEYKRLSLDEEQNVYDTNARLVLERNARVKRDGSGGAAEQAQYIAADTVLHALEKEKDRVKRNNRVAVDAFNAGLNTTKKDYDALERKAYKSYEHVETFTSTANLC